ncbi:MAG: ABC transporter permease [Bacillota bacterium]
MTFSLKRSLAILQKDYKDVSKNMYVSFSLIMPLAMAAYYGRTGVNTINVVYMVINLALTLVATYLQSALIAEEKEKNTLRGLMLSPASPLEIIGGKSLLSLITTIIALIGSGLLLEYQPGNMIAVGLALFLSCIFYIGIGTLLGLATKSVMEASIAVLPIVFFFSFTSYLTPLMEDYPILEIMPNLQLVDLANKAQAGTSFMDVLFNIAIILLWAVVINVLAYVMYKKRMVDE